MKRLTIITSFCLLLFSFVHAQGITENSSAGLKQGDILAGLAPCFSLGSSGEVDSESSSSFNSIGTYASVDYFATDNFSVGASVGAFRDASSSGGGAFESKFSNTHVDVGLNANFYPPNCFCDGEPNDARFRPFAGINTSLQRGRQTSSFDGSESVQGFQGVRASLSAGLLVNLKNDVFMGVEGDVISLTRRRNFNPDTGTTFSNTNNVNVGLNKSLMSINFAKKF